MHMTLAQALVFTSTAATGWLMVRAGTAKKALKLRRPDRCPSCGRLRSGRSCHCTDLA